MAGTDELVALGLALIAVGSGYLLLRAILFLYRQFSLLGAAVGCVLAGMIIVILFAGDPNEDLTDPQF